MKGFFIMLAIIGATLHTVHADDLLLKGKVSGAGDTAVKGAIVSITVGFGGSAISDTTGEDGVYQIATRTTGTAFIGVTYLITAQGHQTLNDFQLINNASDGSPDTLTRDFRLLTSGTTPSGGDSVLVSGKIAASDDSSGISGATVSISFGITTPVQVQTDNSGLYSVKLANPTAARSIIIAATADEYQGNMTFAQIANPANGVPDTVNANLYLTAIVYDTIIVRGTVVDTLNNEPISGAAIITSYVSGYLGAPSTPDTVRSGSDGAYIMKMAVSQTAQINWTVEKTGYRSKSSTAGIPANDTVNMGTIRLMAYSAQDSVTYRISGRVTDQTTGIGLGGAKVIVSIESGSTKRYLDTVTTSSLGLNRGSYTATVRLPYIDGNITVTAVATVNNYREKTVSSTVASSTSTVTLDIALVPENTSIRHLSRAVDGDQVRIDIFTINGKLLYSRTHANKSNPGLHASFMKRYAGIPLVIRSHSEGAIQTRTVIYTK